MCAFISIEENELMTLQVGLVAKNGFVLASDRKAVRDFSELPDSRAIHYSVSSQTTKILISENKKLVCAFSGSKPSVLAAQRLIASCPDHFDNDTQVREYLAGAGKESKNVNSRGELVIVGFPHLRNVASLWSVTIEAEPTVHDHSDKVFGGEETNPAVYLIESYYKKGLPVSELVSLAAYFVCEGNRLKPSSVGGLDIFVSENDGEGRFLTDAQKEVLDTRSPLIHKQIEEIILRGVQRCSSYKF